jgi:hypothetical protein
MRTHIQQRDLEPNRKLGISEHLDDTAENLDIEIRALVEQHKQMPHCPAGAAPQMVYARLQVGRYIVLHQPLNLCVYMRP